jgi:hypothetical protein
MTHQPAPLVFTDVETTGLNPAHHVAWEIAVIRRDPDGTRTEHLWQIRLDADDLTAADPKALQINRYFERSKPFPAPYTAASLSLGGPPGTRWLPDGGLEDELDAVLGGAVIVGSNPDFDVRFLAETIGAEPGTAPWHYRPLDVATLAAGALRGRGQTESGLTPAEYDALLTPPYSSRALSRALGVEPPGPGVAHTALGDARWAEAVYDAAAGITLASQAGATR